MPPKKQTTPKETKTATKKTAEPKVTPSVEQQQPVAKKEEAVVVTASAVVTTQTETKPKLTKSTHKAGRTLLVKSVNNTKLTASQFESLAGLQSSFETKSTNSFFLTFDTIQNAVNAFRSIRTASSDNRVKFSYYRLFFTINGLTESSDYNQVKKELFDYVSSKANTNVLYCKFYRKNDKYLGCGDFTVDTLDGINTLLSKEGGLKEYSFGNYSGTFYRYNSKKDKNDVSVSQ
jgi:hypothetical protein